MDNRLKKQKDFDLVFKNGKRLYSKSLTFIFLKNSDFKYGIALSKKHGHAVTRNRIKRLIRAAFYQYKDKLNDKYLIVIMPKISESYNFINFSEDLEYILKKGKLIDA